MHRPKQNTESDEGWGGVARGVKGCGTGLQGTEGQVWGLWEIHFSGLVAGIFRPQGIPETGHEGV